MQNYLRIPLPAYSVDALFVFDCFLLSFCLLQHSALPNTDKQTSGTLKRTTALSKI